MTQPAAIPLQFVDPALRAIALAAVAGTALLAFRVRSTSLHLIAWRGVLYAALAMPALMWVLPPVSVPVPKLLQTQANELPVPAQENSQPRVDTSATVGTRLSPLSRESSKANLSKAVGRAVPSTLRPGTEAASSRQVTSEASLSWSALATWAYLFVALLLLGRIAVGIVLSRRLLHKSATIIDGDVTSRLAALARASGVAFVPEAVESCSITVPVTIGIGRSKIVLPANWKQWDEAKLDAVLAHELSHVARRDALTQFFSLLHRAIFWFSPLAWWLDRHLADLAEQASDEAALSCGANRNDYARTLLGFLEALHAAPGRVWWQGVSMAKTGQAEKRLERILAWKGMVTMSLKKSVIIALFALAIPAVYLTAAVQAANPQSAPTPPPVPAASAAPAPSAIPSATPAPDASPIPEAAVAPVAASGRTTIHGVVAPAAVAQVPPAAPIGAPVPVAAIAPPPPAAAWPGQSYSSGRSYSSGHGHSKGFAYAFGYDDEQRFVIVSGNSDSMTMSGTSEDARHVEKLKRQISGDFIWFSRDEKSYIIRDQATVARARAFWAPQEELGKKQEELGKKQEELGRQQEALGKKQEEVRVKVPDMTAELDRLRAKLQKMGPTATMEQLGELQSEIGELQSKIGEIQSAAGDEQGKLGEEQGALGEKQGKLGEEQGKLGEEQGRLAEKATREMKGLLDEAIKNGKAQPEPESGSGTGTL